MLTTDVAKYKTTNYISIFIPVRLKQTLTVADVIGTDQKYIQYGREFGHFTCTIQKTQKSSFAQISLVSHCIHGLSKL